MLRRPEQAASVLRLWLEVRPRLSARASLVACWCTAPGWLHCDVLGYAAAAPQALLDKYSRPWAWLLSTVLSVHEATAGLFEAHDVSAAPACGAVQLPVLGRRHPAAQTT